MDLKLEVVILPVSNAERTKQFFASLGWREDADFVFTEDFRVLQFTPPGSEASLIFGTGVTNAVPGSVGSLLLAVDDIEAARAELIERGVECPRSSTAWRSARTASVACPARTPSASPTARSRRSAIPTGTSTCCRRSPPVCPAAWTRRPSPRWPSSCWRPPCTTTASRRPRRRTTGGMDAPYLDARQHGSTPE